MRKYFIQTFGCAMNQADSEKVNMLLLQAGFMRAKSIEDADLVIFNTCSVRQKGEDRVFGIMNEISKINKQRAKDGNPREIKVGITGCMVRRTGISEKYLENYARDRRKAKNINLIEKKSDIFNNDDKLFPRSNGKLDFTFRIEDIRYLPHILTEVYGISIGNDAKFDDYLKSKQQRENPHSATIIIQTGCDNYCTFCIVPYTRGKEISRPIDEIATEAREAVKNGAKEITLVGQNVNSYGKQFVDKKLWNEEKSSWNTNLRIGIDVDDVLISTWENDIFENYNEKYGESLKFSDIISHDFIGNENLKQEFYNHKNSNWESFKLYPGAENILKKLSKLHQLYIITSRDIYEKERTISYLENIFGKGFFSDYIFTKERNSQDKKCELAKQYNFDIVIDDAPHHVERYEQNTDIKTLCFTQPWNKNMELKAAKRVNSWSDIQREIDDFGKSPFRKLLEELDTIEGLDRVRFTSSNPHDMTQDILDAHFDLKTTCNYLHFALQSGNNKMLRKMNRRHKYEDFKKIVDYLRRRDPNFSISTDIIVGYSGETEEMFEDTVTAFDECQFDFAFNARYSVREGTIASKMFPDDITDEQKAQRWHILNDKLLESITQRNKKMLGNTEAVLISGQKDEYFFGRTRNFKEVYFSVPEDREVQVGDIVTVELQELDRYVIKGKLV